jgi:hypothetical protein
MVPNTTSVWNLLHINLLAPRNFWWLPDFWKICAPLKYGTTNKQHIQNLNISNKFLTKMKAKHEKQHNTRNTHEKLKHYAQESRFYAGMIRNPCSFVSRFTSLKATVKVTTDVLHYLCDLLVCGSLIFHCWLKSTWGPVFIFQPLPHFGRWWTVRSWIIPSVPTALLLTRHYSRRCGRLWRCHSCCRCWLWFWFSNW